MQINKETKNGKKLPKPPLPKIFELEDKDMEDTLVLKSGLSEIHLLQLPDGCSPGKMEAVEVFARLIDQMRFDYGDEIQYIPFSYKDGNLTAILAIIKY